MHFLHFCWATLFSLGLRKGLRIGRIEMIGINLGLGVTAGSHEHWESGAGRKETRSRGRSGSAWPVLCLNRYDLVSLVWLTGMISVRTQTGHKHGGDHSNSKECDQR